MEGLLHLLCGQRRLAAHQGQVTEFKKKEGEKEVLHVGDVI